MSHLSNALESVSTHRDVVPCYYLRSSKQWIVTGIGKTNGGAVLLDDDGQIVNAYSSKRDALASIGSN